MVRTVTRRQAVANIDELLNSIDADKATKVLGEEGLPIAFVVSPEEFLQFHRNRFWATLDQIRDRNEGLDPDDVLADMTEVVEQVRRERRGN